MNNTKEIEYSWINFKINKRLHTKFSMILKLTNKSIREVMTQLVAQYVQENSGAILEIISEQNTGHVTTKND